MDTTNQYRDMCDCGEIQGLRDGFSSDDIGEVWVKSYRSGGWMPAVYPNLQYVGVGKTWLPRQDQIQAMLWPDGKMAIDMVGVLLDWFNDRASYVWSFGQSMEQLWLAYYMHTAHGKAWNGSKWE